MQRLLLLLICCCFHVPVAEAVIAIKKFETQIEKANDIVTGKFKEAAGGQTIFVAESSLKGMSSPGDEIVINIDSQLAWRMVEGGGPTPPLNDAEFAQQIRSLEWYPKKVILAGVIKEGKWISCCYDWSVWTSGASTRDETLKGLSFEELVEVIKSKVVKSEAINQKKSSTQADKAETTSQATPAPKPPPTVQPPTSKTPAAKPTASQPSEEPASSTPWSIITVLIVAAIGLLWMVLKRR